MQYDRLLEKSPRAIFSYFEAHTFGEINRNRIMKNIDSIVENPIFLYYIINAVKQSVGFSEEELQKLNEIFENELKLKNNRLIYVQEMMKHSLEITYESTFYRSKSKKGQIMIENLKKYSEPVLTIIEELLRNENVDFLDIENISYGSYCNVYKIGNKILKLGAIRATEKFRNNDRLLQPLVRRKMEAEYFSEFIEISDNVRMLSKKEESKEKLYQLWKELREDGLIWTDPKFSNIGVLNRDNMPNLKNEKKLVIKPESVGFIGSNKKIRKEGEWVIIDTDYIYDEDELDIEIGNEDYYYKFEKRYKKELSIDNELR